jgi:hypothetical protein
MRQAEKETFEQKQNDIRHWIEEATKESFPSADFFKSLRSGVLLCKYASRPTLLSVRQLAFPPKGAHQPK